MLRAPTLLALIVGLALGAASTTIIQRLVRRDGQSAAAAAERWLTGTASERKQAAYLIEAAERVEHEYVRAVPEQQLFDNALRGMVGSLDPYSAFLDQQQYAAMRATTSGQYPGVGVEVAADAAGLKVVRAIADSPAARAGVLAGDIIIRVAGLPVGRDVDAAVERLRGPPGSKVKLSLTRSGRPDAFDVLLERTEVEVHTVMHTLLERGYGYLRITNFSDLTAVDTRDALDDLNATSPNGLRGLILDLRNDPGGVLEAAVAVADMFLEAGNIVSANGRTPEARFRMDATSGDLLRGAPMAVLVNGGSASAAEILAGALKDQHRATLIGRRTFGKGSVQTIIPLSDGRALKLTTSLYFTPSGTSIHERGIEPDITLAGDAQLPLDVTGTQDVPLAARDGEILLALEKLRGTKFVARRAR